MKNLSMGMLVILISVLTPSLIGAQKLPRIIENNEIDGTSYYNVILLHSQTVRDSSKIENSEEYHLVKVLRPTGETEYFITFYSNRANTFNTNGTLYLDTDNESFTLTDATPFISKTHWTVETQKASIGFVQLNNVQKYWMWQTWIKIPLRQMHIDALKDAEYIFARQSNNEALFIEKEQSAKSVKAINDFMSIPAVKSKKEATTLLKELNSNE